MDTPVTPAAGTPPSEVGFPLDFTLRNPQEESLLYILGGAQELRLRITNTGRQDFTLAAPGDTATVTDYHFALAFRPGTLQEPQSVKLGTDDFAVALGKGTDGSDVFYLRAKSAVTLNPGPAENGSGRSSLELQLSNLRVEPGAGTRPTLAQLFCQGLSLAGGTQPLSVTRLHHLNVLNQFPPDPSRHPDDLASLAVQIAEARAPLAARFHGSNTVLNDGETLNRRVLRIANTTAKPLPLTEETRLVLTFDLFSADQAPWGLLTQSDCGGLAVEVAGWEVRGDDTHTSWTLREPEAKEIPPGGFLDVTLTFKCSASSGEGHLCLSYENVSGMPDGEVLVPVQKGPLACRDTGPEGVVATRALGVWCGNEINFYRETYNESTTDRPAPQGAVGPGKGGDMSLLSNGPGSWLRIGAKSSRIAFWTNGNATVDDTPQMALDDTRLSVGGVEIAAVDQGDPGLVGGYLVPKGGIILWSGAADRLPKGWALCDGQNGTPDLRDRFVLGGAGHYKVGTTGGAEEITLALEHMPSHDHGFNDPGHSHGISHFRNSSTDVDDSSLPVYRRDNDDNIYTATAKTGITFNREGGNRAHPNMPPYYALCFIIKL